MWMVMVEAEGFLDVVFLWWGTQAGGRRCEVCSV